MSAQPEKKKKKKKRISSVKIRPLSSIIYLYPSAIMAVICALWVKMSDASPADPGVSGILFTLLFFFNLSVVAFDYTRLTSIVVLLVMVILGLLSVMFEGLWAFIEAALSQPMFMNATFYWVWAVGFSVILCAVLLKSRFDYWEVNNNELLHHHGMLGDLERWHAPGVRITKEINDVMEFALCRAGRLVLVPQGEARAIVIENVPGINRIEREMQDLLSTLRVDAPNNFEE